MLATTLGADPFIGRILTGRVESGRLNVGRDDQGPQPQGEKIEQFRVTKIQAFRGLGLQPIDVARGRRYRHACRACPRPPSPTRSATSSVDDRPARPAHRPADDFRHLRHQRQPAGRARRQEGAKPRDPRTPDERGGIQRRHQGHRHRRAAMAFEVAGRGELQMGVLIENMRREGFELSHQPPAGPVPRRRRPAHGTDRRGHHRRR